MYSPLNNPTAINTGTIMNHITENPKYACSLLSQSSYQSLLYPLSKSNPIRFPKYLKNVNVIKNPSGYIIINIISNRILNIYRVRFPLHVLVFVFETVGRHLLATPQFPSLLLPFLVQIYGIIFAKQLFYLPLCILDV